MGGQDAPAPGQPQPKKKKKFGIGDILKGSIPGQ